MTGEITRRLRARTKKPLIIKLTPNVTHISEFARAVEAEGADAVSVINTLIGMAIDIKTRRPLLATVREGFGPAIRPSRSPRCTRRAGGEDPGDRHRRDHECARRDRVLPGGRNGRAGRTANFIDPAAGITIARGIVEHCEQAGVADVGELVGA